MRLSKVFLLVVLGLLYASCSKQEANEPLVNPSGKVSSGTSAPAEVMQFVANLALEDNLRALEGTKFYRGRLRPSIENGEVAVNVYLGSKSLSKFSPQTLNFKYDETTNSISYRGAISVPEGLLKATDLKMLMLVANAGQITADNQSLSVSNTIKTPLFDNSTFADGEKLADMKVPYSTGWLDVSGFVDGDRLDVLRKKIVLKPLGHVVKLDLDVRQTALDEITFRGFKIESTAVTDRGTYALPQEATQIGDEGEDLVFTPTLGSQNGKIGLISLPAAQEEVITKGSPKVKTMFVWVEKIPQASLKAPYDTKPSRFTRAFVEVKYAKPVMDNSFAPGWWNGFEGRNIPVYYSNSNFSKSGSTMSMLIDNPKVVSPIDRMAYTYMGRVFTTYEQKQSVFVNFQDDTTHDLGAWGDREKAYQTHYSWSWLESQNFVGDARVPITFPSSREEKIRTAHFRIPTLEELAAIFPTQSVGAGLRLDNHNGTAIEIQSETVKLGSEGSAPASYSATYQTYTNMGANSPGAWAVRFKGGDNRYKTLFMYRLLKRTSKGSAKNQVQTYYLGSFYPEINTPQDYKNFATAYPDATGPWLTSERILPTDARNAMPNGSFRGHTYWVATPAPTPDQATYVSLDYTSSNESVQVKYQSKSEARKRAVIVIRDI